MTVNPIPHTHNPLPVSGQAASYDEAGWKDYCECDCGMYFEADRTTEIADLEAWKSQDGSGYVDKLKYEVAFEVSGGEPAPEVQYIYSGETVTKPETPSLDGAKFVDWLLTGRSLSDQATS